MMRHSTTLNRLLLSLILMMSGCFGRKEEALTPKVPLPFTLVKYLNQLPENPVGEEGLFPNASGVGPQGYIIRSQTGLAQSGFVVNSSLAATGDASRNSLDWSRENLVILSLGVQGTTGHTLRVEKIEKEGAAVIFAISHIEPRGAVGEALTHPAGMIRLASLSTGIKPILKINDKPIACEWHIFD